MGPGFEDVNEFLRSLDFSPFNLQEMRPKLVQRIKALQPKASNRAIAKAIGVDEGTVRNDQKESDAENSAPKRDKAVLTTGVLEVRAENSAPDGDNPAPVAAEPAPMEAEWFEQDPEAVAKRTRAASQAQAREEQRRTKAEAPVDAPPAARTAS